MADTNHLTFIGVTIRLKQLKIEKLLVAIFHNMQPGKTDIQAMSWWAKEILSCNIFGFVRR